MKILEKSFETKSLAYILIFCGFLILFLISADYIEMPTTLQIISITFVILLICMGFLILVRKKRINLRTENKSISLSSDDEGKNILLKGFNEERRFREQNITKEESAFLIGSFGNNNNVKETKPLMEEREALLPNRAIVDEDPPEEIVIKNKIRKRPPNYKDIQDAKKLSLYYEFTGELYDLFNRLDVEQVEKITKHFNKGLKDKIWLDKKKKVK